MPDPAPPSAEGSADYGTFQVDHIPTNNVEELLHQSRKVLDQYQDRNAELIHSQVTDSMAKKPGWWDALNGLYYLTIARLVNPAAYNLCQKCLAECNRIAEQDQRIPKSPTLG